tara:strand:+ start:5836 stop:6756 length:921 start_codon:yes stop_codon:yes gene_type:complete
MIVAHKKGGEYPDVINSYYELERFSDGEMDKILFQGYSTSVDTALKEIYKDIPMRIYLNLEAPCAFASTSDCIESQNYFTHVYTLCPYTCEFMNSHQSDTKFIPIPFPFRGKCFENLELNNKTLDVIYMGTMMCQEHADIVESMKPYQYNFASLTAAGNPTMCNVSSQEKWEVLSKTKASIAINMCPLEENHITSIKSNKNWDKMETFNNMECGYMPQIKPRVIEAMCTKTVNLVKRDSWNVIEKWFEEGKHFIYWDDISDLQEKLKDVVENYDNYKTMVESAYERVYDFEIDKLFDIMKEGKVVL